ncbi:MAG: hypothetical protein IIA45_05470 [Bacteroidetes bacterium]|nr:hypothetical protein [Bacteroidota bacterium]
MSFVSKHLLAHFYKNLLLTLITGGAIVLFSYLYPELTAISHMWANLVFFFFLSSGFVMATLYSMNKVIKTRFVPLLMLGITLKLLLSMAYLLVYFFAIIKKADIGFLLTFLVFYLSYTILSITHVLKVNVSLKTGKSEITEQ